MAPTVSIPRFLLLRGPLLNHPLPISQRLSRTNGSNLRGSRLPAVRTASSSSSSQSKPRLLEKPSKFTASSHSSRYASPSQSRPTYGPDLTPAQKVRQQTASYPHTMPPPGTWAHYLINSRMFHTVLSLSVLLFFALWTWWLSFKSSSPYYSMLPSLGEFFKHPLQRFGQVVDVYKLQVEHTSQETKRRREKFVEDGRKARAYRVLQGLEPLDGQGLEVRSLVEKIRGEKSEEGWEDRLLGMSSKQVTEEEQVRKEEYMDFEGKKKPVKKWFGIW